MDRVRRLAILIVFLIAGAAALGTSTPVTPAPRTPSGTLASPTR